VVALSQGLCGPACSPQVDRINKRPTALRAGIIGTFRKEFCDFSTKGVGLIAPLLRQCRFSLRRGAIVPSSGVADPSIFGAYKGNLFVEIAANRLVVRPRLDRIDSDGLRAIAGIVGRNATAAARLSPTQKARMTAVTRAIFQPFMLKGK